MLISLFLLSIERKDAGRMDSKLESKAIWVQGKKMFFYECAKMTFFVRKIVWTISPAISQGQDSKSS